MREPMRVQGFGQLSGCNQASRHQQFQNLQWWVYLLCQISNFPPMVLQVPFVQNRLVRTLEMYVSFGGRSSTSAGVLRFCGTFCVSSCRIPPQKKRETHKVKHPKRITKKPFCRASHKLESKVGGNKDQLRMLLLVSKQEMQELTKLAKLSNAYQNIKAETMSPLCVLGGCRCLAVYLLLFLSLTFREVSESKNQTPVSLKVKGQ